MEQCPSCNGSGKSVGFVCPGFRRVELVCSTCKGTGKISDVQAYWRQEGEALRKWRREAMDWGQMEAAKWAGVSVVEWSKAEHGQIDPRPIRQIVAKKAIERFTKRGATPAE